MKEYKVIRSNFGSNENDLDEHLKLLSVQLTAWAEKDWNYLDSFVKNDNWFVVLEKGNA